MNRKEEATVVDGRSYSLAALANGSVRQAYHREHRHHAVTRSRSQVDLDIDDIRVNAKDSSTYSLEKHSIPSIAIRLELPVSRKSRIQNDTAARNYRRNPAQ